jgi:phage terminase large subunit
MSKAILLAELEVLLVKKKIEDRKKALLFIDENTPKNYSYLKENYQSIRYEDDKLVSGKKGVILEGGARSRKTYSFIDFLIWLCLYEINNQTIIIIRDTYNSFHTTLFTDLEVSLDEFGLQNPFKTSQQVTQMKIRNNRIHFKGADNPNNTKGAPSYILYFNEMLTIPQDVFNNYIMRCSGMWVGDFNPSVTQHWVFDKVVVRPDVGHLRTTYKDNPLCPVGMKIEIMGYEPFEAGSYQIENDTIFYNGRPISDTNQPPPHIENVKNNTADLFMHKVYGLGLRGAMQGVIFQNIRYIDEFPKDLAYIYANDFGFTSDPNAFGRYSETETEIFVELLLYEPIETPEVLGLYFDKIGVERDLPIICDSSDKYTGENKGTVEMVLSLQDLGFNASKVSKRKSIMFWILSMKNKRINIVENHLSFHAKKEAENYRFKEVAGILINQPIDKFNHFWDMTRYGHISWNNPEYDVAWD